MEVDRVEPSGGTRRGRQSRARRARGGRQAALRGLLWKLHFFGGLLAAPILLSLAVTGILYAWNPQIEQLLYDDTLSATTTGPAAPLSSQVSAAKTTHPDWTVTAITPAAPQAPGGEETTAVTLVPPDTGVGGSEPADGAVTVYVDPATTSVTGRIVESQRPDEWLRNLHSSWRLGPVAEPLTELAASWLLVSLLTGLYLWWPRTKRALRRALRFRTPGRPRWRSLHGVLGVATFVGLLALVGSGLSWTNYAGGWIDVARAQFQAQTPVVSTHLGTAPTSDSGGHQHHGGGSSPATADDRPAGSWLPAPAQRIDRVAAAARAAGLGGVTRFEPPTSPRQAWTAGVQDSRWPIVATAVAVAPGTGEVVDRVEWGDYPLLAKATTLGIAFHQAQLFGLVNQIGLTLLALALIVLIVAGYRTWWLRRPAGRLGLPPRTSSLLRSVPVPLLLGFGALMILLPVLGVSFVLYLAAERAARGRAGTATSEEAR